MGNPVRPSNLQLAYAARFFAAFAAMVLTTLLVASVARAGDVGSSSSTAAANDTGSAGFLYAGQTTNSLLSDWAWPTKDELLEHLSITGYGQSNYGVYINSHNTIDYHHHINSIESLRQLLQIDTNESVGDNVQLFLRSWFVYEPEYPFEIDTKIGAKSTSDFYNTYGPREYWVKLKTGPLTSFVGNQIVTWGESLAFRIADVINPQDLSYAFGFNNLEASHNPIQMLHEILNLPKVGPFSSNFLETVYAPGLDPLWNHVDYPDDRYEGQNSVAGRVNILPDTDDGGRAAGRTSGFGQCVVGISICIGSPYPNQAKFINPPFSTVLLGGQTISTQWKVPRATFGNSQVGVRLHSLIEGNTEATLFYWRSFDYSPVYELTPRGRPGTPRPGFETYRNYQGLGATANRPLYELPQWLVNKLPFVVRGEMFYKNHETFNSTDPSESTGLTNSDTLNTMFALDVDSAPAPWLTTTGTLNSNLEWVNTITFDSRNSMQQSQNFLTPVHHNETQLFFDLGTSWWWNAIAPSWAMIYGPDGNTFLLTPTITLTPPWTNKYFLKLATLYILGSDRNALDAGGSIKGLSAISAQFQYNFKLL
jgi:hypothetical protein